MPTWGTISGHGVLRRLLAVFVIETDVKGLDKGKEKTRDFFKEMQKVAAAFAGGAIAKGIAGFVKDTVDEMMGIRKGAQELKITTDEMQQLQSAARATGMDVKWLHFTLERLEVNVERAGHGAKRQAEAMKLLGITSHDASGKVKSAKTLFLDFATGFEKVRNQNTQARAVWDLMGRGAHRLLPLLRMGRARIEELMHATDEYGKYEKENLEQAAEYAIVLEHMHLVWVGIKSFIMSQWLPVLQKQTEGVIKVGKWLLAMAKDSKLAAAGLYALQAAMGLFAAKMLFAYPVATMLAGALVALVAVLDDLMVWADGGHSLIADAIDALFGKGQSTAVMERMKTLYHDLLVTIEAIKVALGMRPEQSETDVRSARGGGAAAPSIGATDVNVRRNPLARMFGGDPNINRVPGGVEVERGFLDRFFDPNGNNVQFSPPPLLDTQSRPDDGPNMSIDMSGMQVNVTLPEGANNMSIAQTVGREVAAAIQSHTKAAAASLRRERRP